MPAKLWGGQQNANKIPILGLVPESASSEPSAPVNGQLWFDTSGSPARLKVRENGAWVLASQAGVVLAADSAGGDLTGTFSNLQIAANAVGTTEIANDAVTLAKLANIATDSLIGRDTTAAGDPEVISVGGGIEFTGSGGIQTSAHTGDVTKTAGGTATTIASNAVTLAKLADMATDSLLGRDTASTGDPEVIGVGGGIEFTGAGAIRTTAFTGDVTKTAGGTALTIANNAVTVAKLATAVTLASVAAANASAGDISASSQKITNLAPSAAGTDAVNRNELDAARQGFAGAKDPVRVRVGTNVTVASPGATLDGVSMSAGDRVLLSAQTTTTQAGIYVWNGAAVPMTRALDADAAGEVKDGTTVAVSEGTTGGSIFIQTATPSGAPGSWSEAWIQFNTGGTTYTAGAGLVGTTTFDVVGTANRISVAADSIDISASYVGQASITTLGTIATGVWNGTDIAVADGGTGSSTAAGARTNLGATGKYAVTLGALTAGAEATITHNLNSTDVVASFKTVSDNYDILMNWRTIDANSIGVTADVAFSASAVRAVVIG